MGRRRERERGDANAGIAWGDCIVGGRRTSGEGLQFVRVLRVAGCGEKLGGQEGGFVGVRSATKADEHE